MPVCPPSIRKIQTGANQAFIIRHDTAGDHCEDTAGWQDGSSGIKLKPNSLHFFPIHWHFDTPLHNNPTSVWPSSKSHLCSQCWYCLSSCSISDSLSKSVSRPLPLPPSKPSLKPTNCSLKHSQLITTNKGPFHVTNVQITRNYWLQEIIDYSKIN